MRKKETLEEACLYFRDLTDYKLMPRSYVIVMLDGRSFSKHIKNRFEKPFSDTFIEMMNKTAEYVCSRIEGAKIGYVQSDEISFVITDFDTPNNTPFFKYRLSKLQSIIASSASGKFNQLLLLSNNEINREVVEKETIVEFDCKAWNVPSLREVYAWFLYRQFDCKRNSILQYAQFFYKQKEIEGLFTEDLVEKLIKEKGKNWNKLDEGYKFGRFVWKEFVTLNNIDYNTTYQRSIWKTYKGFELNTEEGKNKFLSKIPKL